MQDNKTTASDYALRQLEAKDQTIAALVQKNQELKDQLGKASSFSTTLDAIGENFIAIALILFIIGISISGIVASLTPACPVPTQIQRN